MSLIITKETANLFSLVFDGGLPIKSEQNRLTTIGNLCNFKSGNGANLILKQNIPVTDITLIASGTFTFTNTNDLFTKLFGVNFFGFASGGGSSIDRFDELSDTFDYFGRDGQVVTVNESQLRLETQPISLFTPADRDKLDDIEAKAEVNVQSDWNETDPESDSFILNKPTIASTFSAIYQGKFVSDGESNIFVLPIGAQAINLFVDRGIRYNITEWTQENENITILGDILTEGSDIYITGMQA
jgi:hypothetical protein